MQELRKIADIANRKHGENKEMDFLKENITEESSYTIRNVGSYLQKMNFDTPVKLQKELQEMWTEEPYMQILEKIIVVAAFKFRSSEVPLTETISEKVYNF